MLQQIASKIDPIYGIISLILCFIAFVVVLIQLFLVRKERWDQQALLALDETERQQTE